MKRLLPILTTLLLATSCDLVEIVPSQDFKDHSLWETANPSPLEKQLSRSRPKNSVLVGVLDSGVDYFHPRIMKHIDSFELSPAESELSHGRTRGIGWDVIGSDFFPYYSVLNPEDGSEFSHLMGSSGHGTHVAQLTTLGRKEIRLFPVRVLPVVKTDFDPCDSILGNARDCQISFVERAFNAIVSGIQKCNEHGCQIINMSLGIPISALEVSQHEIVIGVKNDLDRKIGEEWSEILFVVAAGNESTALRTDLDSVPATLNAPNILSVGALDDSKTIASYSNYQKYVDVYTKGNLNSSIPGGGRETMSGTSMATPLVTHLAARLKAIDPTLKPEEIRAIILNTADLKTLPVAIDPDKKGETPSAPRTVLVMNAKHARASLQAVLKSQDPEKRAALLTAPFPHGQSPYR